jgi:ABC-type nitrate/sulfonate/bicarbonate transport system permease component
MGEVGAGRSIAFRGGGFDPKSRTAVSVLAFVVLIGLWQASSSFGWVSSLFLPSPVRIAAALQELIASGELWGHVTASVARIGGGWLLGVAAGTLIGGLIGLFSAWRSVGVPLIAALFPIPKIALLPLFILWLGIGELSKVVTIALGVFYPVAIGTYAGVDNVARNLIRMGQSFNLPYHHIVWKIVVPGTLPSVLASLRISTSIAMILMVSAEMIGAERGLGTLLLQAGNLMQTDKLMAAIVVVAALGLMVSAILTAIERALLTWR